MEYQLRSYVVEEGRMEDFLAIFPAVVAARRAAGFEVVGAWTIPEEHRFVWIVATDGSLEEAAARYYESAERRAITPEPATLLAQIDTDTMEAVPTG